MRVLAIFCVLFLLVLSISASPLLAATHHACTSPIPPQVSGQLVQPPTMRGIVLINEVLLQPRSNWNCSESGGYTLTNDTWVELYNPEDQPFDLYAVHAGLDSGPRTNTFYFPFGAAIAAHGFLVVFPRTSANFLSTETSILRLLITGVAVDEVSTPTLPEDNSYARIPDGSSNWQITDQPTTGASNTLTVSDPTATATKERGSKSGGGQTGREKGGSSSTGSNRSDNGENGSDTTTNDKIQLVDGVQPTWTTLHLPTATPNAPTSYTGVSSPPQTMHGTNETTNNDTLHKILFSLLAIALSGVLFWCWRLFRTA